MLLSVSWIYLCTLCLTTFGVSISIGITELTNQFQKLLVKVITSQAEVYT